MEVDAAICVIMNIFVCFLQVSQVFKVVVSSGGSFCQAVYLRCKRRGVCCMFEVVLVGKYWDLWKIAVVDVFDDVDDDDDKIMMMERKGEEGCCRWKGGACCCAISMSVRSPGCGVRRLADLSAMMSDPMGISDLIDCVLTMYMLTVVNNLHFQSICHSPILAVCVCSVWQTGSFVVLGLLSLKPVGCEIYRLLLTKGSRTSYYIIRQTFCWQ